MTRNVCGGCGTIFKIHYCSLACQRKDRKRHKPYCGKEGRCPGDKKWYDRKIIHREFSPAGKLIDAQIRKKMLSLDTRSALVYNSQQHARVHHIPKELHGLVCKVKKMPEEYLLYYQNCHNNVNWIKLNSTKYSHICGYSVIRDIVSGIVTAAFHSVLYNEETKTYWCPTREFSAGDEFFFVIDPTVEFGNPDRWPSKPPQDQYFSTGPPHPEYKPFRLMFAQDPKESKG